MKQVFAKFGKIKEIQTPHPNYCFVHFTDEVLLAIATPPQYPVQAHATLSE